jgi:hypothetical protein
MNQARAPCMREISGEKHRQFFDSLLADAGLDGPEIFKALADSLSFIEWGEHREMIEHILGDPDPRNLLKLIANSQSILSPLQEWVSMERNLNALRMDSMSREDYYDIEYRCSQIQNFILLLKLY